MAKRNRTHKGFRSLEWHSAVNGRPIGIWELLFEFVVFLIIGVVFAVFAIIIAIAEKLGMPLVEERERRKRELVNIRMQVEIIERERGIRK